MSWKKSSAVSCAFCPTLSSRRPRVNPGVAVSTQNRLMPRAPAAGSVFPAAGSRSAGRPLVMKVFWPLMT